MVKFSAGYSESRQAYIVGLGLTDGNLGKLMQDKPLPVASEQLGLPAPGWDLIIIGAQDKDGIGRQFERFIKEAGQENASALELKDGPLYLMPLSNASGRVLYVVGFTTKSCEALRRNVLSFRARSDGKVTPVEVVFFWGSSEDVIEENMYASGLIGRDTKVEREPSKTGPR